MTADSRDPVQDLIDRLNEQCGWDCAISAFDGWKLVLASGTSDAHVKPLAALSGVSFLSCPTQFSHPRFSIADDAERQRIAAKVPLEESDLLLAIEAETMAGLQRQMFFIAAESLEIVR